MQSISLCPDEAADEAAVMAAVVGVAAVATGVRYRTNSRHSIS